MKLKVGDKVKCITKNESDLKSNKLTYGKVYEVKKVLFDTNGHRSIDGIKIIDDRGHLGFRFISRFEKVSEETASTVTNEIQHSNLDIRLQKAEEIIKEFIEYKRKNNHQWSHNLQKYVEEFGNIDFTFEE